MVSAVSTLFPRNKPPPLWFVTNGDVTVGPVTTNLLVRGVLHERVPSDCLVRQSAWRSWRGLGRIREVAALRKAQARGEVIHIDKAQWNAPVPAHREFERLERDLLRARDPSEMLTLCLFETMSVTGALVGAVHRRRPPGHEFVTTCVFGPGMDRRLGRRVSGGDPAVALAMRGDSLCELPHEALASGAVQNRLGAFPSCSGIVMIPVLCFGRLYALIELGRPDHEFREVDHDRALTIGALGAARLGIVQNCAS